MESADFTMNLVVRVPSIAEIARSTVLHASPTVLCLVEFVVMEFVNPTLEKIVPTVRAIVEIAQQIVQRVCRTVLCRVRTVGTMFATSLWVKTVQRVLLTAGAVL